MTRTRTVPGIGVILAIWVLISGPIAQLDANSQETIIDKCGIGEFMAAGLPMITIQI